MTFLTFDCSIKIVLLHVTLIRFLPSLCTKKLLCKLKRHSPTGNSFDRQFHMRLEIPV
jgi:hypothetical protein